MISLSIFNYSLDANYLVVLYLQKLLKAAGLFAGSIFLMCNYGDLMAI